MADRTIQEQLVRYLADAHAIEAQSLQLLDRAQAIAGELLGCFDAAIEASLDAQGIAA